MNMQLRTNILAAIDAGVVTLPGMSEYLGRPAHHLTQTVANLMADEILGRSGTRRFYRYHRVTKNATPSVVKMVSSVWDLGRA